MPDKWEIMNGLRYDVIDSNMDNDNDGLSNLDEYIHSTDPNSADSDGDSTDDYTEIKEGTDPLDKDRLIWPFVFFPILILIFVLYLFLEHRYHIDSIIKQYYAKYFQKKPQFSDLEHLVNPIKHEIPTLSNLDLGQIKNIEQERRIEKEKMMKTFNVKLEPLIKVVQQKKPKHILQPKPLIKQIPSAQSTSKTNFDNKNIFERLKKIR
jgi:hypothetical protein